jgi:hypothetical protein
LFTPEETREIDLLETPNEEPFWNEDLAFAFALLQAAERPDYNMVSGLANNASRPERMETAWSVESPHLDHHRGRK